MDLVRLVNFGDIGFSSVFFDIMMSKFNFYNLDGGVLDQQLISQYILIFARGQIGRAHV